MRLRTLSAAALTAAAALALAACGADADTSTGTGPATDRATTEQDATDEVAADAHNAADTEFAQMMIVHHEGAIEMAELAVATAASAEVRALGERIAAAQGPEIATMSGWLEAWGEDLPAEADMSGMGHEGMQMEGMDQEAAMAELSGLTGAEFDRRFLELMIEHHRGAIVMAEQERGEGENAEAVRLAGAIIDDQTAEITEMTNLRNAL
ncbi:DUF305 domain-containing protein [Actinotalea fermentans]|uniref:Lipoprotein n=1 Tax=Actinotalea fermentans TaxID=43671 RepID=A0A511Z1P8_9CELL|nr:DUF305 domain-containing protein [Actinotalea fermentans]KGM16479.1 hypothetical protein N867_19640 [Actinotalea fermentans ATCC 43279 = JCM 9966 = DSM 3133]GEN81378.1 lipoprotein [Actinotalea fermentans]